MTNYTVNYQAPSNHLQDRVILVTGAGQGIGKTASLAYAQHGATVILLDKQMKNLEATYDAIQAANYPEPLIFAMDLERYLPAARTFGWHSAQCHALQ
jgi:NAD(P)-dependent dehydrogenase (short-subunit alcohol dehydrogenase family)